MPKVSCSRARPLADDAYAEDVRDLPAGVWGWLDGQTDLVVTLGEGRVLAPAYPVWWEFRDRRGFARAEPPPDPHSGKAPRVLITVMLGA